ncbi:D-alanine--D-alanine ligase [Thermosipho melanesiensis]|uniref:D-alanine--D-alanine ligase n=2 Tax=Thermosipho melanesiensis TaxID=46541 RepID=DDL_THEM4|nr:D-alanine--D-alanine ligase family protein [Thermosipho melanesiensis]A6LKA2.1 RecName: Full=D-alanine--D-alanine ligase; AltName: Full=D-Ala-D-Ala ligase; AltName: Full=D-alanylalanine synthetase [Thermosipho melanesiensis BI429]ABR30353.1 D-alanine--D-alanine ligase [Thermosipho melanesiensis BI429]APT73519.1 D-alanine--D-alanine ligase [Thermosipho melanesiensis]OOC37469.1 D-alanine--D-alanine ligase [Thermosipho melanesiensis]OOC39674.1 D-alanine--D-alanine ligase [Thermosipho melanesie
MLNIGIFFGSKSVEHEISIITAQQVLSSIDRKKYNVIPIYISKSGEWFTGKVLEDLETFKDFDKLEKKAKKIDSFSVKNNKLLLKYGLKKQTIDFCFLVFHGTNGEDGTFQGMCEIFGIPYSGCNHFSSAFTMDKVVTKLLLKEKEISVVDFEYTTEINEEFFKRCEKNLGYPMIVKPARLGSSIGVSKVVDRKNFEEAVKNVLLFDNKVLVEKWINAREINCAVMGYKNIFVSELEEINKKNDFFNFEEKYFKKGKKFSNHIIPARIDENLKNKIKEIAKDTFKILECSGNVRIDFLIADKIYVNEINTIPGALSFYIWQKSGFTFSQIIDNMINMGLERFKDKKIVSIDTNILKIKVGK